MKKIIIYSLIFLIIIFSILLLSRKFSEGKEKTFYVIAKMSVSNVLQEVCDNLKIGDYLIDSSGNKIFVIVDKIVKDAEHPVETSTGEIVKSPHPIFKSIILTVKSVNKSKKLILSYNRTTVRVGGKIIFETDKVRFVGTILSLDKE
ncbi:MAG: DUF4330 domain-containing protein [Caldisericia bacterium]|nr:DUF4330 domain-containing protein [Caldisericia bacterium]